MAPKPFTAMMFIIMIIVIISPQASAQEALDEAYFKFYYEHVWQFDTIKKNDTRESLIILQVGPKVSKSYSYSSFYHDSIRATPDADRAFKKIADELAISVVKTGKVPKSFVSGMATKVYKNYPEGQVTITDKLQSNLYIYTEDLHPQHWEITDSTQTIMDHPCQMAVSDFRGRRWIAWFAPDIPISDGPWKFSGLPGLIMEVCDKENHFCFTITGIESVEEEPIVFSPPVSSSGSPGTYEQTTRIGFLRGEYRYWWNSSAIMNAELGIPVFNETSASSRQHDLIERDYW